MNGSESAFPRQYGESTGLTIRAYFAGQALAGLLAGHRMVKINETEIRNPSDFAIVACGHADALIAELAKGKNEP